MSNFKNEDRPAFPGEAPTGSYRSDFFGLTKREYFAAMAMQGFITATFTNTGGQCVGFTDSSGATKSASAWVMSEYSVKYAEALIAELEKKERS